jgi:hypothetical protein
VKVQKVNRSVSAPQQIAGENGWIPRIKGRADSKTLVLLRGNQSASVYIGTFSADGTRMVSHERLTLDETMNLPFSWTPDSKAVFFNSTRNGIPVIFKQSVGDPLADVLVKSTDQVSQPRVTSDGSEIVYISTPGSGGVASTVVHFCGSDSRWSFSPNPEGHGYLRRGMCEGTIYNVPVQHQEGRKSGDLSLRREKRKTRRRFSDWPLL